MVCARVDEKCLDGLGRWRSREIWVPEGRSGLVRAERKDARSHCGTCGRGRSEANSDVQSAALCTAARIPLAEER
jgi:hypothetical protein